MTYKLIISLILHYSTVFGVNPNVALSVAQIESNFNPKAVGPFNERGVFQLNPKSYPEYSVKSLSNIELNIFLGVRHLKYVEENCSLKNSIYYVICYNKGIFGGSKIKHPKKDKYYLKVSRVYKKLSKL